MASQDYWKRITLRIPHDLHEKLQEAGKISAVNAEIVKRLVESFEEKPAPQQDDFDREFEKLRASLETMFSSVDQLVESNTEMRQRIMDLEQDK